jgi:two-component system, LytTR family, response regulator
MLNGTLTKVVIVEDHSPTRSKIKTLVNGSNIATVCAEANSVDVAREIIAATQPELLLLDVHLGSENCFDLLSSVDASRYGIIFLTSYDEYAIRAIKHGALDYLLKPVDEIELLDALKKAAARKPVCDQQVAAAGKRFQQGSTCSIIAVNDGAIWHVVDTVEIIYATSVNGNRIVLQDNQELEMTMTISQLEERCQDQHFIRPHVSYLVNKKFIRQYNDKTLQIQLKDGTIIPVSARVKTAILSQLIST